MSTSDRESYGDFDREAAWGKAEEQSHPGSPDKDADTNKDKELQSGAKCTDWGGSQENMERVEKTMSDGTETEAEKEARLAREQR